MELVDTEALKASDPQGSCGFESHSRHQNPGEPIHPPADCQLNVGTRTPMLFRQHSESLYAADERASIVSFRRLIRTLRGESNPMESWT